ncbi:hypothetical protein P4S72_16300 [Vibrio sp. PP-XX7]
MNYDMIKVIHALAAVAATGPLLFAPWLSARLKTCQVETKTLLLKGLSFSDTFYNIAGWVVMLSGIVMFWLQDWHRIFQLWFMLSVVIFVIDSIAEKMAGLILESLENPTPRDIGWTLYTQRIHKAVMTQTICTALIFAIMLLHSQLSINLLNLVLF